MPESETEYLDYYPPGWTEQIHDEYYIEWVYEEDPTICVRIDGTLGNGDYSVIPITGVNPDGEEYVTKQISGLLRREAFGIANTLVYAMKGTVGRLSNEPDFIGDKPDVGGGTN